MAQQLEDKDRHYTSRYSYLRARWSLHEMSTYVIARKVTGQLLYSTITSWFNIGTKKASFESGQTLGIDIARHKVSRLDVIIN